MPKPADVDLVARRLRLKDTKNRSDHMILLSKQVLELVQRQVEGKTPGAALFTVGVYRTRCELAPRPGMRD